MKTFIFPKRKHEGAKTYSGFGLIRFRLFLSGDCIGRAHEIGNTFDDHPSFAQSELSPDSINRRVFRKNQRIARGDEWVVKKVYPFFLHRHRQLSWTCWIIVHWYQKRFRVPRSSDFQGAIIFCFDMNAPQLETKTLIRLRVNFRPLLNPHPNGALPTKPNNERFLRNVEGHSLNAPQGQAEAAPWGKCEFVKCKHYKTDFGAQPRSLLMSLGLRSIIKKKGWTALENFPRPRQSRLQSVFES